MFFVPHPGPSFINPASMGLDWFFNDPFIVHCSHDSRNIFYNVSLYIVLYYSLFFPRKKISFLDFGKLMVHLPFIHNFQCIMKIASTLSYPNYTVYNVDPTLSYLPNCTVYMYLGVVVY